MIKSYTDINQSKKLAEILPLESADICYVCGNTTLVSPTKYGDTSIEKLYKKHIIPAWSLAALLDVLPEPYQLTSNKEGKVQLMLIHHLEKDYYDNPVDACVSMIEKLNELKML